MAHPSPISNAQLVEMFDEMADLLELSGENMFRVRAYRTGAAAIATLSESVAELIVKGGDLTQFEGIGSTLADKSKVIVETGRLLQLEALREKVPPTLRSLMRVPGLGAKKAMRLFQELGVVDLVTLKSACDRGAVASLKGFGEKTQQSILQNLTIVEQASHRLGIDAADALVERLRKHLETHPDVERLEFAGSYRRRKESVGDLDILVTSPNPEPVMDHFSRFPGIQTILARGETKMSVRVSDAFQIDMRVVPEASFGAALQYFTGSKEHNVHVRSLAKARGFKLNEYGLMPIDSDTVAIASREESEIYEQLGLPWIPPELRENRFEFESQVAARIENLIRCEDMLGDLHMHTTATDGENSIEEMANAARARGLRYIAITDHSKRVAVARGLDEARAIAQWNEIERINAMADDGFFIFRGIECDILEDGSLDLSDSCLQQADWVTASIHFGQKQSRDQITDRILGAIRHPSVHAISHPTGRLISRRAAYDVDLSAVYQAAAEFGKCLEINAHPERLDLNDVHAAAAAAAGVMIVINTDAHAVGNLDLMQYGVAVARRAGLSRDQVLNTRPVEAFREWLVGVRQRA